MREIGAITDYLPAVEIETASNPEFSVIWMHGLGADGNDFAPVVPQLRLPPQLRVRFVFPHAPVMPVTLNHGYPMPAWYDILSLDRHTRQADEAGLRRSCAAIARLIERENRRGVPASRIVLAGFSQGGAIAYTVAFTYPERLAGVLALSTYIPSLALIEAGFSETNRSLPVFAAHGEADTVLPLDIGIAARDALQKNGCAIAWHVYPMGHSVCVEELADIGAWLRTVFTILNRD
jgi:phospholipase/carboxylesterase